MTRLIVLVLLFPCFVLHAQDGRGMGVFYEESPSYPYFAQFLRVGMQYRQSIDVQHSYRLSISLADSWIDKSENSYYRSNDTTYQIYLTAYLRTLMPVLSAGLQHQRKISKRVQWHYGTDINIGFSGGKNDSLITHNWASVNKNYWGTPLSVSSQHSSVRANILYGGIQPFAGISAKWHHFNVGLELSGRLAGTVLATPHYHETKFAWSGAGLRIFTSYCWSGKPKMDQGT